MRQTIINDKLQMNNRNFLKGMVVIFLLSVLLLLNGYGQNVISMELTTPNIWYNGMQTYDPHLSFPKGSYEVTTYGTGKVLICNAQGDVLAMGSAEDPIVVQLDQDESDIMICSDGANLTSIQWQKEGMIFRDTILIAVLIALFCAFWLYKYLSHNELSENDLVCLLLTGAVLLVSYPLFTQTILYGQDATFHLYRIEGIKDGILAGQFPVRIHPTQNNAYGYAAASAYPELFLYVPAFLRLFGISNVLAYQIFLVMINILTVSCMYIAVKGMSESKYAGAMAAIIYTFSTWRVINLYYRAAIGEALALAFFPLLFYGLYCILKGNEKKWWIFTFACTGIFMSHMISTLVAAIVVILLLILCWKDTFSPKRFLALVKSAVSTILLNAWFLVAFFVYYVKQDLFLKNNLDKTEFCQNAIIPTQLFDLFGTGFGSSLWIKDGIKEEMSLTLGLIVIICLLFSIGYYVVVKNKHNAFLRMMFYISLCLLFMTTTLFPWPVLQKSKLVLQFCGTMQFPWRLFSIASAMIVMVAVINFETVCKTKTSKRMVLAAVSLVAIVAFGVWGNAYIRECDPLVKKGWAVSTSGSTGWGDEYFRTGTNLSLFDRNKYTTSDEITLVSFEKNGSNVNLQISGAKDGSWVEVPLLNYPGYEAVDNLGNKLEIIDGTNNVVKVVLCENATEVSIFYGGFWYFRVAEWISILSLGAIIALCYKEKKSVKNESK